MSIRLTHILYLLLLIYPSSLLGGSILHGDIGTISYIAFSLYIIFFSLNDFEIGSFKINYDYLLIFSFLFILFKIFYNYNSTYFRELIFLTTTYFFFQKNASQKILNIFYIFIFVSVCSLLLFLISFIIPLDLIIVNSDHKSLSNREFYEWDSFLNYGNLLLNRYNADGQFLRYSGHFLEPSFLWFFGLLFYQINQFRLIQSGIMIIGTAYYGVFSVILSALIYLRSLKSWILISLLALVFTYLFYDEILIKILQFEFMSDKGFFLIPEISLFGSKDEIELKLVGLGILLNLFKYGIIGLLLYLFWLKKILYLQFKVSDTSQAIVLLAFSIYCFKMPFFIGHLYFVYILANESIKINAKKLNKLR
tara:strand:+ start:2730 stop:3824 length:1095 start_codon:yes stop_codon:yes gene_type:complete